MTLLKKILDKNYVWGDERIGEDAYEELLADIIIDYLKRHGPECREMLARGWRFDNPPKVIKWIAQQPDTDRGTILRLYWMMDPGYGKQFATIDECAEGHRWYVEEYDIIKTIERNYAEGFYRNERYAFDPGNDGCKQGYDWTKTLEGYTMKDDIPQEMFIPTNGTVADTKGWADGVPPELKETISRLEELIDD